MLSKQMYLFPNRTIQEKYFFYHRGIAPIFGIITLLLLTLHTVGQTAKIDTLFLPVNERFKSPNPEKLKFPIIKTGNKKTDARIESDLKNKFTNNEYPDLKTDSTLIKWAEDIVTYIDFDVTYNKKGIISLTIFSEGCGAHCSNSTDYFNYSLVTGNYLNLNDIVDTLGAFRKRIYADMAQEYKKRKDELKETLLNEENKEEYDKGTYDWALEYYNSCERFFNLENFVLKADELEIKSNCYLPNAIKYLSTIIELKYKYANIKEYLKIKN